MIDYNSFQSLFILSLLSNSLCLEDLFLNKNCHKAILKRPHHKGSSWNKVIKVHENELRLCQKKCGKPEIQQTHCRQHEPEFVKDLGFQIKSDKCCDRKSCKCICSYFCRTLKSKAKELKVSHFLGEIQTVLLLFFRSLDTNLAQGALLLELTKLQPKIVYMRRKSWNVKVLQMDSSFVPKSISVPLNQKTIVFNVFIQNVQPKMIWNWPKK